MPSLQTDTRFSVLRFVMLRRYATDLRRSLAFYCDGLGFEIASEEGASGEVVLALGAQRIVLAESEAGMPAASPVAGPDARFQHVAIVASDMRAAFERLQTQAPVPISLAGPQRLPAASGGACAFKFRDPDAHPLELIEFPAGTGAACWRVSGRHPNDSPTLGIDHAAISVSNVERSIAFYERLGFRLDARQVNRGAEQARLDGLEVSDAVVEVVALVASQESTPHLELLGYRAPEPTRSDANTRAAADRLVWQDRATHDAAADADRQHPMAVTDPDGHLNWFLR